MTPQETQAPPFLTAPGLEAAEWREAGFAHGFFGREGGVSQGLYASLNTGHGSNDETGAVAENRRRCAAALGVAPDRLVTAHQTHSADAVFIDAPWPDAPAQADALVTTTRGLALGALAADCMPWLLADAEAGVIASAHAGWRGALAGVLENTVALMARHGAKPGRIRAALGPCLRQPNFEVGLELVDAFEERFDGAGRFFAPDARPDKRRLDLAGFGAWRLAECGVAVIDDTGACTLGEPSRYFSYRDEKRRAPEGASIDYGRNLSAIALR